MRRLVACLMCLALVAAFIGCAAETPKPEPRVVKPPEKFTTTPTYETKKPEPERPAMKETSRQEPKWVQQLGEWELDWKIRMNQAGETQEAKKWMFIVGSSKPVASIKDRSLAIQTASQDALFHLSRALGFDFTNKATNANVWATTPTGEVVSGMFRKALEKEMAKMKLNLREYANWGYTVKEGVHHTYVVMVLYRLNRERFVSQNVLKKAADEMNKELAKRKDITKKVRMEASSIARKMVEDAESALKPQ